MAVKGYLNKDIDFNDLPDIPADALKIPIKCKALPIEVAYHIKVRQWYFPLHHNGVSASHHWWSPSLHYAFPHLSAYA